MTKVLPSDLLKLSPLERAELASALASSLSAADRETALRALLADVTQRRPDQLDLSKGLREQGIDSLQAIIFRERVQSVLGAAFTDDEWASLNQPSEILTRATPGVFHRQGDGFPPVENSGPSTPATSATSIGPAAFRDDLEIGMPLTGRNNLAETPLLQYLGDRRWRQISDVMGVASRDIADEDGERLYATFFFVELAFPPARPMATFGENDRLAVHSTLSRFGTSMVDGISYLVPADAGVSLASLQRPNGGWASVNEAVAAGIPAARLSNIFVKQFGGAEWLKKGRPAHAGFTRIPEVADPPDSYMLTKQAEQAGTFRAPDARWTPMTTGPVTREYRLVPDRDLNGAGLVYFANYPMFLDVCERDVLSDGRFALPDPLIDRRTLLHRRSAYLNNASSRDTLRIEIEPWLHVEPAVAKTEAVDVHLHLNCRMYRRSDDRMMMVSTVDKVISGVAAGELPFLRRGHAVA